jgi:hypothetical protein
MPNSSKIRQQRKRPTLWVPESFHPESTLPPHLLLHTQSANYLMHAIIVRVAYGGHDVARLKMRYLRNVMGSHNCKPIVNALIDSGDIRRVGNFVEGKRSFGYLPGPQYETARLRKHYPTDPRLLERLEAVSRQLEDDRQRNWKPIHDQWQQWQTPLTIDRRQAERIIADIPLESNPYDIQTLLVDRIRPGQHRFILDPYGRVHNSITSLHRTLRPALRIQGQPLASLDIINSQPAMLAVLTSRANQDGGTASNHAALQGDTLRGGPQANSPLTASTSIYDAHTFTPEEGVVSYQQLATSGRLYEHLMDRTGLTRAEVKVGLLRDVFGKRGWYPSPVEDAFKESFPGPWRFVRQFNRDDHAALLRELQRVESDLVIERVGPLLVASGSGPFISLHDSVYCRGGDLEAVQSVFDQATQEIGVQLKLKVEAPELQGVPT